jgi:hypothetical protein
VLNLWKLLNDQNLGNSHKTIVLKSHSDRCGIPGMGSQGWGKQLVKERYQGSLGRRVEMAQGEDQSLIHNCFWPAEP